MENNIEITNEIYVEEKKLGKILTFWSPQVGCGSTFISYRTAKTLATQGKNVCMVDFDLRTPTLTKVVNTSDTLHYLDNLLPYAEVDLSQDVFESHIQKIDENLSFIAGNNNTSLALDIQTVGLNAILTKAVENFDYVIVDVNAAIDNAGTFVALDRADTVYVLTEKRISSINSFDFVKHIVTNEAVFDYSKFILVINRVTKEILLSSSEVEKYFDKDFSIEIPDLGVEFINEANIGHEEEFLTSTNKKFVAFNEAISSFIKETINVDVTKKVKNKKGFSLFGRKGGK